MREFFQPLRRKLGVLLLVVACVAMALWVRTLSHADAIRFSKGGPRFVVVSGAHSLCFAMGPSTPKELEFNSYPTSQFQREYDNYQFHWRLCGCGIASLGRPVTRVLVISYWSIFIPSTLLSAWLLLTKPRNAFAMR